MPRSVWFVFLGYSYGLEVCRKGTERGGREVLNKELGRTSRVVKNQDRGTMENPVVGDDTRYNHSAVALSFANGNIGSR